MVIVDDSTVSFGFNLDNGIPILPFKGEEDDAELLFLYEYLSYLKNQPDFRKINRSTFKMHLYSENKSASILFRKMFK